MTARIATLNPTATELVSALGLSENLVGVSHHCDHVSIENLPILTETADYLEIHDNVNGVSVVRKYGPVGSPYELKIDALAAVTPDIVIASAADIDRNPDAHYQLPEGVQLLRLEDTSLADLSSNIRLIAEATDTVERVDPIVRRLVAPLKAVRDSVASRQSTRVVILGNLDPYDAAPMWLDDIIELAGGYNALHGERPHGTESIVRANPEVIVFAPGETGLTAATAALWRNGLADLAEEIGAALWSTDSRQLFSRCTPQSVIQGARVMARIVHPEVGGPPATDKARCLSKMHWGFEKDRVPNAVSVSV